MRRKFWRVGVCTKLSIARCGLSGAYVILECVMCTRIIMVCMVCAILTEHREMLLVRMQCGYMLLHDSLINGVCGVLVHSGGILKFGMVQLIE
jgi:hypothetical protein